MISILYLCYVKQLSLYKKSELAIFHIVGNMVIWQLFVDVPQTKIVEWVVLFVIFYLRKIELLS